MNQFKAELCEILEDAFQQGFISKEIKEGLIPASPRTPCLYLLPKVHKDLVSPPGRPIVSGNGSLNEMTGKFLDFYLRPSVESLPSYLKDTGDVLRKLEHVNLEEDMWLVTMDIEALYTSIRHHDGLHAVNSFLCMTTMDHGFILFLLCLLEFSLTHNFFIFNDALYLQLQGTAMWAAFAPSYANLFLGLWERDIFCTNPTPLSTKMIFWVRYIDDVLAIWQGSEEDLVSFIRELNQNNINLKLTYHYSRTTVDFLDVCISKDGKGLLHTEIHRKDTAVNSLLHASSAHPKALKNSIPVGQFMRTRRVCSDEASFVEQAQDLATRFEERGYSERAIRHGWRRASRMSRNDLLHSARKRTSSTQVRFISTFNNNIHG
ncbi:uncharacterized protein [Dendrobates tinctorius]|uniref:uncharacterized protein isoform X2 n=1 Tax=Dendrobates tinctorius TaxID=92724 RepID=UPI003CCA17D1